MLVAVSNEVIAHVRFISGERHAGFCFLVKLLFLSCLIFFFPLLFFSLPPSLPS